MARQKAWLSKHMIFEKDLLANGVPVKLEQGCLGFCAVWKTKAAARKAGKKTDGFVKVTLEFPSVPGPSE